MCWWNECPGFRHVKGVGPALFAGDGVVPFIRPASERFVFLSASVWTGRAAVPAIHGLGASPTNALPSAGTRDGGPFFCNAAPRCGFMMQECKRVCEPASRMTDPDDRRTLAPRHAPGYAPL